MLSASWRIALRLRSLLRSIILASLARKSKNEIFGFYSLRSAIKKRLFAGDVFLFSRLS